MVFASAWFGRAGRARRIALACLTLAASARVGAAGLPAETIRAYEDYVGAVRQSFVGHVKTDRSLVDVAGADMNAILKDGRVLVRPAREDGIIDIPGGLIHHWKGVAFIPHVTLQQAISASQDYANYKHVYETILDVGVLEHHGDTFRVQMRVRKSGGPVSAVLDVWSDVEYQSKGGNVVYSVSNSERIMEVENAGKPNERRLPLDQGRGYLWRAQIYSRFAEQDGGVLTEMENIGLSRTFPPLLGWIIEPVARRIGRGSVEESLSAFRTAVISSARQANEKRPDRAD